MPLVKSGSKKALKTNVRTLMHDVGKSPHVQSPKQAIAIAYATARRYGKGKGKAFGGPNVNFENMMIRGASYGLRHEGMISGNTPGRTDNRPLNVRSGSYVVPSDIPSALGQGNTNAGAVILKKMFSSGPYGLPTMHGSSRVQQPRLNLRPPSLPSMGGSRRSTGMFAKGGETNDHVPIVAASGEFIISPEVVRDLGHGDINKGHKVLDRFILNVRKKHIKTLKSLPPPKK